MILLSMGQPTGLTLFKKYLIREEELNPSGELYKTRNGSCQNPRAEIEKMNIEHIMEITYEQKRSRDQLLGN